ncbi:uncharacterized protein FIBRA_06722 [Fibroporia radiculosa]|uniref:Uncharacterized protein n=1 Tax=Fibroporia radiculosa TaxID=599839 RepID=J4IBE9_9APHY|nr:uncharacterized protein FIBRA_06722 [Fibroporia radiculosa]CCM04541.1 predicted protein [Fibroporia radiculosa]
MPDPVSLPSTSSDSTWTGAKQNFAQYVHQLSANLALLPAELCPPSPTSSVPFGSRTRRINQAITDAVGEAYGDPTSPKWGHVSALVKLGCTSRGYVGVSSSVRMGDTRKLNAQDVDWVLPETAEEWVTYERRWCRKFRHNPDAVNVSSKYWSGSTKTERQEQGKSRALQPSDSKAIFIREKVASWQANVVLTGEEPSILQFTDGRCNEKEKVRDNGAAQSQGSLGFAIIKRTSSSNSKSVENSQKALNAVPSADGLMTSRQEGIAIQLDPLDSGDHPKITDLSEMSFLPPSFPSQLQTSTPRRYDKAKPAPIVPHEHPSSPLSSPPPTQALRYEPVELSSGDLAHSPSMRPRKHPRVTTPTPMDISDRHAYITPSSKRPRIYDPSSGAPLPPSTPPQATSSGADILVSSPRSQSAIPGLGNFRGLPVPTTPERQALPTLTDLLASSRRSKPRPRPPSRNAMSSSQASQRIHGPRNDVVHDELPVHAEVREPSPARTFFSSPASGSSGSSTRPKPRSPISPLFSQNPAAFAPRFTSSQHPRLGPFIGGQDYGSSQDAGGPLRRESSGIFGLGYNSQFDVEGQVDRVNELLHRDVDYDGWLHDVKEIDEDNIPLAQSQPEMQLTF